MSMKINLPLGHILMGICLLCMISIGMFSQLHHPRPRHIWLSAFLLIFIGLAFLQRSTIFGRNIITRKICMLEPVDCILCVWFIFRALQCRVLFLLRLLINPFNVKSLEKWRNIGHIDQTQDGTQWVVWLKEEEDEENVTIWWYSPVRSL